VKSVSAEGGRVFGFFATLSIVAFVLNWLWEMIQMPAYARMDTQTWKQAAPICTIATLGEVGISLAIYFLGALVFRRRRWA
jgi:tellurite resistance protein TehA-like permease